MNTEPDQFERRLGRQPLRQVPAEWREEILAAGVSRQSAPTLPRSFLSTLNHQLSTFLWPHPVAWAGLAAVWILIFAVDFSTRDRTPLVVQHDLPPPVEVMVEVHQQQQLLVELLGLRDIRDADRSKSLTPQPRSQRAEILNT